MPDAADLKEIMKDIDAYLDNFSPKDLKNLKVGKAPVASSKSNNLKEEYINNLNKHYYDEELVLILGAGISVPYKLPSWNTLLQKLLFETFNTTNGDTNTSVVLSKLFPELFPSSPLISARFLEEYFRQENKGKRFDEMVKKSLYENIERNADSTTIQEILQYCIAPGRRPNLDSIITYNYDDILEQTLLKSNVEIPFKSIYKVGMNPENGELPIYHVHGYLPEGQVIEQGYSITLSENLYHKQYIDVYSWNNMVQINKFKDKVCIFIGISLSDPNMRRLLDIAKLQKGESGKFHYMFKLREKPSSIEKKLEVVLNRDTSLMNEKTRANLKLEETAKKLLVQMEEFEELDAASFGIKLIWIDSYDEIADVLKKIRTK